VTDSNSIDADIRKAETLPSGYYTDATLFETSRAGFGRHWHFAAHESQLGSAGILGGSANVLPLDHLEHQAHQPMLLTRDDGELSVISNVCTHRGMLVASKPCQTSVLQCPYHGRTFGLNGRFRNMPQFEGVEDFPSKRDDLKRFAIGKWNGFAFTGVEPDLDFDEWFAPVAERMSWWPLGGGAIEHTSGRSREWDIQANWALYVDNYLEGFHIPFVHGDLNTTLEYDQYHTELFEGGVLQIGIAREGEPCFDLPEGSPDHAERVAAFYWWLFPGLMLNFYPWGLSVNLVLPETVNSTRVMYRGYVTHPELLGAGAGGDLDKVEMEDQAIVEACQRGLQSATYDRGRYSPSMERGLHYFHRLLTK
jgi:choline monooxygenase